MEQFSPGFGVFIMMSNYFHDVATVLLFSSAYAARAVLGKLGPGSPGDVKAYIGRVLGGLRKFAVFSVVWIAVGLVPRVMYYRVFELANARDHGQVAALMVKHSLAAFFIVAGAVMWIRISGRAKEVL